MAKVNADQDKKESNCHPCCVCFLFVLSLLLTPFALAETPGLMDRFKSGYDAVVNKARQKVEAIVSTDVVNSKPLLIPEGLPANWKMEFYLEPVFNSRMLVVEAGKPQAETVVLVHGLGQNGFKDWLNLIPVLEEKYHVVAFDLPGFGHSAVPSGRYSPDNYARIIGALLEDRGYDKVHVVGHSLGAAVTLRYASKFPEQVKNVVLVDAAGILDRTAFMKHSAEIPASVQNMPDAFKEMLVQFKDWTGSLVELSAVSPDPTELLNRSDNAWNFIFSGTPNANAALALIETDFSSDIQNIPHPVLIIWGAADQVAPLRTGKVLASRLPDARLVVMPNAGHVPMHSHPEEFADLVLAGLNHTGVEPASGSAPAATTVASIDQAPPVLQCKSRSLETYTGKFKSIHIDDCIGINLHGVTTEKLVIKHSVVELENVVVNAKEVALDVTESVITATNAQLTGSVGILANGSRLDLAGVTVVGEKLAVKVRNKSLFIFSISDLESPACRGSVHGAYSVSMMPDVGLCRNSSRLEND